MTNEEMNYYPIEPSVVDDKSSNLATNTPATAVPQGNTSDNGGNAIMTKDTQSSNYVNGVAGWKLGIDGIIRALGVIISGAITATSGRIATWYINATTISSGAVEATSAILIDAANALIRIGSTAASYLTLDGANKRIQSSDYVAGVSGALFSPTLVESENLVGRATLKGAVFSYDIASAVGGQLLVSNSDTLASDMTAADNSTLITKGNTTFAVNDIILIRAVTALGIQEEYLRITVITSAPTYTVTRDLASSFSANVNPIWKAGTAIVKIGSSDGASTYSGGWLRLIGQGTNAPYYSVFARTGVAYNAYTEVLRTGNLNGYLGYSSDIYGFGVGDSSGTNANITIDPINGLRLRAGTANKIIINNSGELSFLYHCVASDNLKVSADTEGTQVSTDDAVFYLKKEIYLVNGGWVRVKFDLRTNDVGWSARGKIYVNGIAVGTERVTSDTAYTNYSEDILVPAGGSVQLYIHRDNQAGGSKYAYFRNFRIYYDTTEVTESLVVTN